jgi:hypothetical protein
VHIIGGKLIKNCIVYIFILNINYTDFVSEAICFSAKLSSQLSVTDLGLSNPNPKARDQHSDAKTPRDLETPNKTV